MLRTPPVVRERESARQRYCDRGHAGSGGLGAVQRAAELGKRSSRRQQQEARHISTRTGVQQILMLQIFQTEGMPVVPVHRKAL